MASSMLENSIMNPILQNKNSPLSLDITGSLSKLSVALILNDKGPLYDHVYDSYSMQHQGQPFGVGAYT